MKASIITLALAVISHSSLSTAIDAPIRALPRVKRAEDDSVIVALLRKHTLKVSNPTSGVHGRQTGGQCASGDLPCDDGTGCCPIGQYCDVWDGVPGCCPIGKTCVGSSGDCAFEGDVLCPSQDFCCPADEVCSTDATGAPVCKSSGPAAITSSKTAFSTSGKAVTTNTLALPATTSSTHKLTTAGASTEAVTANDAEPSTTSGPGGFSFGNGASIVTGFASGSLFLLGFVVTLLAA